MPTAPCRLVPLCALSASTYSVGEAAFRPTWAHARLWLRSRDFQASCHTAQRCHPDLPGGWLLPERYRRTTLVIATTKGSRHAVEHLSGPSPCAPPGPQPLSLRLLT